MIEHPPQAYTDAADAYFHRQALINRIGQRVTLTLPDGRTEEAELLAVGEHRAKLRDFNGNIQFVDNDSIAVGA